VALKKLQFPVSLLSYTVISLQYGILLVSLRTTLINKSTRNRQQLKRPENVEDGGHDTRPFFFQTQKHFWFLDRTTGSNNKEERLLVSFVRCAWDVCIIYPFLNYNFNNIIISKYTAMGNALCALKFAVLGATVAGAKEILSEVSASWDIGEDATLQLTNNFIWRDGNMSVLPQLCMFIL
jgi:hypothetical protein